MDPEQALTGGRITSGVVRVGNSVRRPPTPASAFVERLLNTLADHGFTACPRHLGFDHRGREVLSFLPGEIPARWGRFADDHLIAVGQLSRRLHDATRPLVDSADGFSVEFASGYTGADAVVCHHDAGPNNVVFHNGLPYAFIDFDFAAPGDPLEDVAYAAWAWCLASKPERGPVAAQARQVAILAQAYGLGQDHRDRLPAAIVARQQRNLAYWRRHGGRVTAGPPVAEVIAWNRRELAYTKSILTSLSDHLSRVDG